MEIPTKSMELWLAGWSKSHRSGTKVTFWIEDEHLPYFEGITVRDGKHSGQRFQAVLVKLTDDDTPDTSSVKPVPVEPPKQPKKPTIPSGLCGLAVRWCADDHFQKFLFERCGVTDGASITDKEQWCRDYICTLCNIPSRKDLDTDVQARHIFTELVLNPYHDARLRDEELGRLP